MKNYFRVFGYGKHLKVYIPVFILLTILGVVFSAFNFALMIPLLDVLFDQVDSDPVLTEPSNTLSIDYGLYLFKKYFLEIIADGGKESALIFICVSIGVSVLLTNLFRFSAGLFQSRIRTDTLKNLRMDLYSKVSSFHLGFFTNERRGDLISRMTNDMQEIETSVLNSLKPLFKEPLTIIIYFIVLFIISVELTLITLVILPVGGYLLAFIVRLLRKQAIKGQQSLGNIVNIFDETLAGMRVIKAFNARGKMLQKMDKETGTFRRIAFSIGVKRDLSSPISEFMAVGIIIGILYYGGTVILDGGGILKPSAFMAYLAVYSQIIAPGKAFTGGISNLQKGLASTERVFEVIDTEPQVRNKPDAKELDEFKDQIEFDNITFSYDDNPVLEDISFTVKKGSTVALVGPSGAGKSTLADLLPRFYDVTKGSIRLDGLDTRDYEIESLRSHMGIVTQESILFNDTVKNNIQFAVEDATDQDIERAAKIANAHEFISSMEDGYDTYIGEGGSRLSGGQRQRLSIARAILKDPEILILDEATSALDSESERLVQEALTNLMKNRTSLVIAHRLSTIQHADEIIVLEEGKIVERGTHLELVKAGGVYAKLSTMQNIFIDVEG